MPIMTTVTMTIITATVMMTIMTAMLPGMVITATMMMTLTVMASRTSACTDRSAPPLVARTAMTAIRVRRTLALSAPVTMTVKTTIIMVAGAMGMMTTTVMGSRASAGIDGSLPAASQTLVATTGTPAQGINASITVACARPLFHVAATIPWMLPRPATHPVRGSPMANGAVQIARTRGTGHRTDQKSVTGKTWANAVTCQRTTDTVAHMIARAASDEGCSPGY